MSRDAADAHNDSSGQGQNRTEACAPSPGHPVTRVSGPRISVVTPSFNQGAFLGRTIDSVLAQNYPNLEHLIVDGMSTDQTPEVLARYRHLRVLREPDHGQADAINKGLRAATGDILCFLNSDDTFAPGTLQRVAREIDPARGRHVVMGRCRFVDEDDRPNGQEHPSAFVSHERILEVWKGHCIPQPAVFWAREVWERCGPLDASQHLVLDFDFFCRVSRHYHFHPIDRVFANYRLHRQSKTCSTTGERVLDESIRVSRRYWSDLGWIGYARVAGSYLWFRLGRRKRAMALLKQAQAAWRQGHRRGALVRAVGCALFAPDVLVHVVFLPALAWRCPSLFDHLGWLARLCGPWNEHSQTLVWRDFAGLHADGWAGPICKLPLAVRPGQDRLWFKGSIELGHHPRPLVIEIAVDDRPVGRCRVGRQRSFTAEVPLTDVSPGEHELTLRCNTFLVVDDFRGNEDYRPVSFRLQQLRLTG